MKKLTSVLLILVLLFSAASCNKKADDDTAVVIPEVNEPEKQTEQQLTEKPNEQTKVPADNVDENDESETVISDSVSTSCGVTSPPDQPAEQKPHGVFPDSLTDEKRQQLIKIANSKSPTVTVSKKVEELSNYFYYYSTDMKELITLLAGFEYTTDQCRCAPEHIVYIGDNHEFDFGLKVDNNGVFESVEYQKGGHTLTADESKKLTSLLDKILVDKNYKSVKGKENTLEIMKRIDNSFVWYSFKNTDADRLIYLAQNIKKTEPKIQGGVEYRFNGVFIRLALNCQKPFISDRKNSAYLTDEQIKEIKDILNRNCTSQNIKDDPDATMPVFIKDLKDETKLYSFTNDASAFLINYIVFGDYEGQTENCTCNAQYTVYSHYYIYKQKNKEIVKDEYNISFVDGIVHKTENNSKTHLVLSKKDSDYVKEIIDKYCIEQNLAI